MQWERRGENGREEGPAVPPRLLGTPFINRRVGHEKVVQAFRQKLSGAGEDYDRLRARLRCSPTPSPLPSPPLLPWLRPYWLRRLRSGRPSTCPLGWSRRTQRREAAERQARGSGQRPRPAADPGTPAAVHGAAGPVRREPGDEVLRGIIEHDHDLE